jgi:DNA-binding transcriptional LysR family regulator
MALEGLGIAVIPTSIVENELADGRLRQLSTDLKITPLTFWASWLESPDTLAVERVADLAARIAQGSATIADGSDVDAPQMARH